MYNRRRGLELAQRSRARRAREDEATRLKDEVPNLASLSLSIRTVHGDGTMAEADHVRRVVVDTAPALFFVPCQDRTCEDGGYDITASVLGSLRSGATRFEGEQRCGGRTGTGACGRILRYVANATYLDVVRALR